MNKVTCLGLISCIVLMIPDLLYSQFGSQNSTSSLNIGFPSPNAASMSKFGEIPVNHSTGIPEISVPLYQAESRHLSIPLHLRYHASGIRVSDTAGWVGLGWSLNTGGAITRVMRGLPDDSPNGYYNRGDETYEFVTDVMDVAEENSYYNQVSRGQLDAEPDVFFLNIGNINVRFMFMHDQSILMFPHQNLKIIPTLSGGEISKWVVTDEDGTRYHFEQKERTYTATLNKSGTGNDFGGVLPQDYVSSWYLTKMESAKGDDFITISYGSSQYSNSMTVEMNSTRTNFTSYLHPCSPSESDYDIKNTNTTYNKFPTQITTPTQKIIFNTVEQSGVPMSTQLNSMEIRDLTSNDLVKKVHFTYGSIGSQPRRLLSSVTMEGDSQQTEPPYMFDYFTDQTLPGYNSLAIDHWGYYNGVTTNTTLFPAVSNPAFGSLSGANRNPDSTNDIRYMRAGSLHKITYPSGGSTTFTYEANDYYDSLQSENKRAGGLRIKQITIHDGIDSANNLVKSYQYNNEIHPSRSSGYLVAGQLELYKYYGTGVESQNECPYVVRRTKAEGTSIGQVAAYRWVTEYLHTVTNNDGYTRYELQAAQETGRSVNQWRRGKVLSKSDFRNDNTLLQEKTFTHNLEKEMIDRVYGVEVAVDWVSHMDTTFTDLKFNFYSYWTTLDSESVKIFDSSGVEHVETSRELDYATGLRQLRRTTETNSDSTQRITEYVYAHEVTDDGTGKNYSGMGMLNMLSQPYSITVMDADSQVLAKNWTRWDNPGGVWRPKEEWVLDSDTPGTNPTIGTALKQMTWNSYDPYGNPEQFTDARGLVTDLSWDATDNYYLEEIVQVNPDPIGANLTGTAHYNTRGLLSTLIDQRGVETSYTYDGFGRLDSLLNATDDVIEDYVYTMNYSGGTYNESNSNHIQIRSYTGSQTRTSRQYMDGLGRPVQSQAYEGSHSIISALEYDNRGREWKSYKPYPVSGSISYQSGYQAGAQAEHGTHPFMEQFFESSPLSRPVQTIPEGGLSTSGSVDLDYDVREWSTSGTYYLVTTTTDEEGKATETWSDGWGRTIRTIADPNGLTIETRFVYDELDRLQTVYHPNHFSESGDWTSEYEYNPRGDLVKRVTQDSGTTEYNYDAAGNLRFSQDANQVGNNIASYTTYDFAGRPLVEGVGDIGIKAFTDLDTDTGEDFEAVDENKIGVHAWDGKPSTSIYPWSEFANLINTTTISNNTVGNLTARAWRFGGEEGVAESASLTGMGITGEETYLAATTITAENTVVSPGASLTLKAGQSITLKPGFHAEAGSRLQASIDGLLATQGGAGISTVAGDNPWQVELFSYDDEGRVKDKWIWTGDKRAWDTHLAYEYNRLGEVTRMKVEVGDPSVNTETLYQHYEYNQLGQLTNVYISTTGTQPSTPEVTYTYTPTGAIDKILYEGGKQADYGYNIRDWVTSINSIGSPGGSFAAFYEYENNGNISMSRFYNPDIDISSTHRDYRYSYTYDELNRLTEADYSYGSTGSSSSWFDVNNLSYDANGNIQSLRRRNEAGTLIDRLRFDYNGNNQLEAVHDTSGVNLDWDAFTSSFGYDDNGNMTSQSGKFTNIVYDHRNLPIHFYMDGGAELIANYNAEGQRILKESFGGGWSFYVTDGPQTLAVITEQGLSHINLVGNGTFGRLVANGSGAITTSNTRYYHITDHLGSTREVVNNSGSWVETFDYYPFGLLMPKRNTASAETREKFTGHERDDEMGLDYMVWRRYDPALGRFLSVDPLADEFPGWSPYSYVFNNPMFYTDPTGMSPVCEETQNCDETYTEGSIVENRLGSWRYLGNNEWETLSLTDNVTELTNSFSTALHWLNNTLDTFHDFGERTLAENSSGVSTTSLMDNPATWLMGGGVGFAAKGLNAAKTGASLSTNGANLSRHLGKLEKYGQGGFKKLQNSRFRYYGNIRPASNVGEMQGARLVREWNPATGKTRTWYETLDHAGKIRQVHPKYNNLPHYKFDASGKYIGKW